MKKFTITLALSILAVLLVATPCNAKGKAKHVVLIGLDGWGAYSVPKADIPTIKQLMADGAYTLEKRSALPSSSAINWASMFMGAGPELHGYTQWGSKTPELPSRVLNQHSIFPTIFQLLRDAQPEAEIGCLYEWDGIKYLVDTLSLSHYAQAPDYNKHPEALCAMAETYIKEYYAKLKELDTYVARIIQAVKDAGMLKETIFIVTADHGGIEKGHGGKTMNEMQTPFIISGKNVKKSGEFHESMMQYDVASTIAYIFGLKQPQVWIGRPMKQVFK